MTPSSSRSKEAQETKRKVRSYIAALPPDARRHLRKLREIAVATAPAAVEGFSYGIPVLRLGGKPLVWYASWKEHISLYPIGAKIRHALASKLKDYKTSKGTVRFPLSKPVPVTLVRQLIKARIAEMQEK